LLERTFVFLKPETVMRGLAGEIISRIERKGFNIVALKLHKMDKEQAEELYKVHRAKIFFGPIVDHVTSGPVILMVVEGVDVVNQVRKMIGGTDPAKAESGTVRGDYAQIVQNNMIHAADSSENAGKEISIFFSRDEILNYEKPTEKSFLLS
jgi:nucleoside-diphosphate kinase